MDLFTLISSVIGGFIIGGICGSLSLIVGIIRQKLLMGFIGLGISIIFGVLITTVFHQPAFLSIIPSLIAAAFIFFLTKTKKRKYYLLPFYYSGQ